MIILFAHSFYPPRTTLPAFVSILHTIQTHLLTTINIINNQQDQKQLALLPLRKCLFLQSTPPSHPPRYRHTTHDERNKKSSPLSLSRVHSCNLFILVTKTFMLKIQLNYENNDDIVSLYSQFFHLDISKNKVFIRLEFNKKLLYLE